MRTQLRTSTEQRRRSSGMCLSAESASSLLHDPARRRSSNLSVGNGQFLAVPDLKYRRASLSTSTSALLSMAEGTRKRGSFTSGITTGSLLSVPQDCEPRRRSLPGFMEVKSKSTDCLFDRRRSSVRPDEVYEQINNDGTRKMKLFVLIMVFFLAFVIGVSFLKMLQH